MRLSVDTQQHLPSLVERHAYVRERQRVGIVHLGIGAFHRAHQAWYTDLAMDAGERDWAICGVSMRSAAVGAQMNPQDGLYTVTERRPEGQHTRLVGSVRAVLPAQQATEMVAAPDTRIVSLTITERGYCRSADGSLDLQLASASPVFQTLAAGLRHRRDAGLAGLTMLSCDNLADNGRQLERLLSEYLERMDPALLPWFRAECACPSAMVDRVVPAPTAEDRDALEQSLGLRDEAAVMTEPFSQWVIEDRFAGPRPAWEKVGVQLVSDVRPFEEAKLRMLNASHSALAYMGLLRGHVYVHEAMQDASIRPLIERLMREEAAPTVSTSSELDLQAYASALLTRFDNPAIRHRLGQIAMDGSQKIPQRWLETLATNQKMGHSCPAILEGIGAWLAHLAGVNGVVDDPRAEELRASLHGAQGSAAQRFFGPGKLLSTSWVPDPTSLAQIQRSFEQGLEMSA